MLHLITLLDGLSYAIEASRIAEVAPLVRLHRTAGPDHLASFRFRGRMEPAIDLLRLLIGRPFEPRLNTRILIVPRGGAGEVVGLIAEHVTEVKRIDESDFQAVGRRGEPAFLGPAAAVGAGWVRRLEIDPRIEAADLLAPAG